MLFLLIPHFSFCTKKHVLLFQSAPDTGFHSDELLCAVFRSLSMPSVYLGHVFPVGASAAQFCSSHRAVETPGCAPITPLDPWINPSSSYSGKFSGLVKYLEDKTQPSQQILFDSNWDLAGVLNNVVGIVARPVHAALDMACPSFDKPHTRALTWKNPSEAAVVSDAVILLTTFLAQLVNTSVNTVRNSLLAF
jgi:hypothetical protein